MKNSIITLMVAVIASLMLPQWSAFAASGEVVGSMEAFLVSRKPSGKETFKPARRVTPGEVIEYRVTYENDTEEPLTQFVINGRIPANTVFVDDVSSASVDAVLEADIQGLGWATLPAFRNITREDGSVQRVRVAPQEYGAVRWRLQNPVEPGAKVTAVYRVNVNK